MRVTLALQALQIDALRAALGWRAAADVERQLVEWISRMPMAPSVDEAATAWAVGVLRSGERV